MGRPPKKAAKAKPKPDEPQDALVGTVNRLQADLNRSVQLNAQLQQELDQLRASLEALRPSPPPTAATKAPPDKAKAEIPAKAEEEPQVSYVQTGAWVLAASAHGDKVVAYNTSFRRDLVS